MIVPLLQLPLFHTLLRLPVQYPRNAVLFLEDLIKSLYLRHVVR